MVKTIIDKYVDASDKRLYRKYDKFDETFIGFTFSSQKYELGELEIHNFPNLIKQVNYYLENIDKVPYTVDQLWALYHMIAFAKFQNNSLCECLWESRNEFLDLLKKLTNNLATYTNWGKVNWNF